MHRLGHHVRRGVAEHGQRLVVAVGQDAHPVAVGQWQPEVAQLAVDLDSGGGRGQPGADRGGRVETGRTLLQLELGAVWELHLHGAEHIDRR